MKKISKILGIVLVIISVVTGCNAPSRKMIEPEDFEANMKKLTYQVENAEDLTANQEKHLIAKTKTHRIDYYVFKTEEDAEQFFKSNSNHGKNVETPVGEVENKYYKEENLLLYEFEDENYYVFLSKIGKSVIYAVEHPVLKESIQPVVDYIGYGKKR